MLHKIPEIKDDDLSRVCESHKDIARLLVNEFKSGNGVLARLFLNLTLPAADVLAKRWLEKTNNPYYSEIDKLAKITGVPGIYALNLSYEWGCSSGVFVNNTTPELFRILDWQFPNLGKYIFVIHQATEVGDFYNVTWPAVSGIFQAMAPGRFSAAINQAPMRRHSFSIIGDWVKNRLMVQQQTALPPSHLLRYVFETANNYKDAKKMLIETPICIPAIYTLSGVHPGEGCIIERLETSYRVRELKTDNKVTVTNHFQTDIGKNGKGWLSRGVDSLGRSEKIKAIEQTNLNYMNFSWLNYPLVNEETKLCMLSNAANISLMIQGIENKQPITNVFAL